jgi:hypothetical protein
MSSTSNSKLNKKTSLNKKNNDKQIFKRIIDAFFANDLDRRNVEKYIFKLFNDMNLDLKIMNDKMKNILRNK